MGQPAARVGDAALHNQAEGAILQGEPSVLIGGLLAARVGDLVKHNKGEEPIVEGEPTVLIGGRPAARVGDRVACQGAIAVGCNSVWIGLNRQGECLKSAGEEGIPFVKTLHE
nr:PAAR domain-containing protein [Pseudomonas sp. RIT-PI-AD]